MILPSPAPKWAETTSRNDLRALWTYKIKAKIKSLIHRNTLCSSTLLFQLKAAQVLLSLPMPEQGKGTTWPCIDTLAWGITIWLLWTDLDTNCYRAICNWFCRNVSPFIFFLFCFCPGFLKSVWQHNDPPVLRMDECTKGHTHNPVIWRGHPKVFVVSKVGWPWECYAGK